MTPLLFVTNVTERIYLNYSCEIFQLEAEVKEIHIIRNKTSLFD